MYKILHFGRSCKAYLRLYEDRAPEIELCCEACGRSLHKHGRYYRSVTTKHNLYRIPIYRLYCPDCGKTISLLPDFLVPWARFATWVREAAITRKFQGLSYRQARKTTTTPALRYSHSTMKRWWKRHIRIASSVALWVAGQLISAGVEGDLLRMYPPGAAKKTRRYPHLAKATPVLLLPCLFLETRGLCAAQFKLPGAEFL